MRTVWVVIITSADLPQGFKLCECVRPEIAGSIVTGLCMAYRGETDPPVITVRTELRSAPLVADQ